MALPHQSIATINSPQFINLQPLDVNPLMSKCEIKVLYVGENRNRSYISKEVAADMAKTLRGAPIVGYYKDKKEDFADHGERMIWDDEGIKFESLTKPFGFVAPDAKVWFQKFNDIDQFGNQVQREYLMTTGYLWTGQYEEVQSVIKEGKPQSMELDEESLQGHWATNNKNNLEFFIINDAIFTKLCILGDDVEPCFEGASVTAPQISKNFSKTVDDNFKKTLFSMMNELKNALKGGTVDMGNEEKDVVETNFELDAQQNEQPSEPVEDSASLQTSFEQQKESSEQLPEDTFEKKEEEEDKQDDKESDSDDKQDKEEDKEDQDDDKKKYSLLEQQYTELSTQYNELKQEQDKLVEFKKNVDNEKKDALIEEFYMLSDEDKAEIVKNKEQYSLDEIKAKLAVICFEKKVNFNSDNSEKIDNKENEENIITYTYSDEESSLPDWVKAVKNIEKDF